ncbi:MAG: response regulator [bacterium]
MSSDPDTVLLVDDHSGTRAGLRSLLENEGLVVETATNGREALQLLQAGLMPCIIVLDLDMPVMTGCAFRQAQMAYPQFRDIPVVLFSGDADLAETAERLEVADYAAKPIDAQKMRAVVLRHCRR